MSFTNVSISWSVLVSVVFPFFVDGFIGRMIVVLTALIVASWLGHVEVKPAVGTSTALQLSRHATWLTNCIGFLAVFFFASVTICGVLGAGSAVLSLMILSPVGTLAVFIANYRTERLLVEYLEDLELEADAE